MKTDAAWMWVSEWALSRSRAPAALGRPAALLVVAAMLLSIGLADYASGIRISLAVFYLVPILLAVAWFEWPFALAVAIGCVGLRLVGDYVANGERALPIWVWWNSASSLVVFLIVVWVFSNLLSVYRDLGHRVAKRTSELLQALEQRRLLEQELLTLSSHERNSMGQELHDDICQHLVATTLAAQVLTQRLVKQESDLAGPAMEIVSMIEQGTAKTRQLARGLLLSSIAPEQLPEKLDELAEEGSRSGVPCRFRAAGVPAISDSETAAQLYRIAQEAMRNAIRHAEASQVDICLSKEPESICLTVEDDGRGLPDAAAGPGMGLRIMSYRAAYIGASISWAPRPERGTRLICRLPAPGASM